MRRWVGIVVVVAAAVATACSGDSSPVSSGGPATQAPTEAGLRAAVTKAGQGLLAKDTTSTYQLLTARCRAKVSPSEWATQLLVGLGLIESFSGVKTSEMKLGAVEVRNVTGTTGEARLDIVKTDGSSLGSTSEQSWDTWLYEDGAWRSDSCDTGGGNGSSSTSPSEPTTTLAPGRLGGDQGLELPPANGATVAVVAHGPIGDEIPVVVRNGTDHTVYDVGVTASVRDPSGKLVVTGKDQGIVPPVLGAGDVAVGAVSISGALDVPTGSTTAFAVTSTDTPGIFQSRPLGVTEVNNTGKAVVGTIENTTGRELSSFVTVIAACFDATGAPTAVLSGSADQDRIADGGTGTFTLSYDSGVVCDKVLVGASASG